ncbi:MAG: M20 family metallopeptidase [Pseudomonadota bacterium]
MSVERTALDLLHEIRAWVEIETHTPDAAAINGLMTHVAQGFEALGATVERFPGSDGHGDHILASSPWGGEGPGVLVMCHLDTVHPHGTLARDLPFRIDGDRAYGPGIYDMKGGAFLAFAAFRAICEAGGTNGLPVRILFTSDEEVGSPTSRALIERLAAQNKYVLVTEPARDGGRLVTARKGVGRFHMTANGKPAHSGSRHHEGVNAILEIARQIVDIEGMTDYERGVTFNIGQVHGGTADNVVPAACTAAIDMRVTSMADGQALADKILSLKPYDERVRLDVVGGMNRPPYEANAGGRALFQQAVTLAEEIGFKAESVSTGGASDGNFTAATVPTLDGLGVDGEGAHTLNEHLLISSIVPRMMLQRRLMESLR